MTVRKLFPFGIEISGASAGAINAEQTEAIKQCLAEESVVILRDQPADDNAFISLLKRLGPLTFTQGETPVPEQPLLNVVSNLNRHHRSPRSVFHTDTSYVAHPPAYTALRAVRLPESGGETLFSSQYTAFKTLPNAIQQRLENTKVLHVVSGLASAELSETECWHPLFKQHPLSQRTALFLSTPERCQQLSTVPETEKAKKIIRLLYKHSIRKRRLYRHRWRYGDVVIWDNRCTMHRADHSQVVGDRILHRALVSSQ